MSFVCTICQDLVTERPQGLNDPNDNQDLIILAMSCGHVFHRFCVREWFHKLAPPANGQAQNENGACPCCKNNVSIAQGLRLFPSGDEEGQAIAEKINQAKDQIEELKNTRGEIDQLNMILEDIGCQLENEKVVHEILRFEHTQLISETDELKRQFEEQTKLYESQDNNWKTMVEKLTGENQETLAQLQEMERRYVEDRQEREDHYIEKLAELNGRLEIELADKDNLKIRLMEDAALKEIKRHENLLQSGPLLVDAACQTDGRDAALLQARLVSYKSCVLHMQSEVRQLESEYEKLKELQPVDESFGSLMNDALNKSVDVILMDSSHDDFDQVDKPNRNDNNMAMSTGDGIVWVVDQNEHSSDNKSLSSHDEEYGDAPAWAIDEK